MPSVLWPQVLESLLADPLAGDKGRGQWELLLQVLQLVIAVLLASPLVLRVAKELLPYVREHMGPLFAEDAASAIRELFPGDLAALALYDGSRYPWNRREPRGFAQRIARQQILRVLQKVTGAKLDTLDNTSPEDIEESVDCTDWAILSLGSPIANVVAAHAMGYHLAKPSVVRSPLPYMFDYSYVDHVVPLVDKTWAELQTAGRQEMNPAFRPPNWRMVSIDMDRASDTGWTDLQDVMVHPYTPEPINESDPLARFRTDYAVLSRTKSRVRSGNDIIVAGCHGEGTIAASRALEDRILLKQVRKRVSNEDEFQVLLKVSITTPMPQVKKPLEEKWFQTEIVDIAKRTGEGWTSAS